MNKILILLIQYEIISIILTKPIPQLNNIFNRKLFNLNGKWKYIVDLQEVGYYDYRMNISNQTFFLNHKNKTKDELVEYNFDTAPEMEIPSDWNSKNHKLFFYEGTIWFKKSFNYTLNKNKRAILYFGAINYESIVYLNGKYLGKHVGGFTPFNFDITDIIKNDKENFLIIKIDNTRKFENVPSLLFDWWNYGGITRDVFIIETNKIYIQNYNFTLNKKNYSEISFNIILNDNIYNKSLLITISELNINAKFYSNKKGIISGILYPENLILWSPENPKFYTLKLKLEDDEELIDQIGFRSIEVSGNKILLNGNEIFLRGVNIHEEKPNSEGRLNSYEDVKIMLDRVIELGCNFVRLAHYPHNEYMIREAEKKGILIWEEIPVYWTIAFDNIDTLNNAKNQLTEIIYRDINRANVIIWSIANETPLSKSRDNFLSKLAIHAKSLDNSRLISMAIMGKYKKGNYDNIFINDNIAEYLDIISFNNYFGWYGKKLLKKPAKINWIIPYNKPVIISEFGAGAKQGYHGDKFTRWTEEFQENVYIQNLKTIEKIPNLVGTVPWILNDFLSPRRMLNIIQDLYNRKGIFSNEGEKKLAFNMIKKFYEKKKEKPLLRKNIRKEFFFCFSLFIIKISLSIFLSSKKIE